jgi:hypothetical protein
LATLGKFLWNLLEKLHWQPLAFLWHSLEILGMVTCGIEHGIFCHGRFWCGSFWHGIIWLEDLVMESFAMASFGMVVFSWHTLAGSFRMPYFVMAILGNFIWHLFPAIFWMEILGMVNSCMVYFGCHPCCGGFWHGRSKG